MTSRITPNPQSLHTGKLCILILCDIGADGNVHIFFCAASEWAVNLSWPEGLVCCCILMYSEHAQLKLAGFQLCQDRLNGRQIITLVLIAVNCNCHKSLSMSNNRQLYTQYAKKSYRFSCWLDSRFSDDVHYVDEPLLYHQRYERTRWNAYAKCFISIARDCGLVKCICNKELVELEMIILYLLTIIILRSMSSWICASPPLSTEKRARKYNSHTFSTKFIC